MAVAETTRQEIDVNAGQLLDEIREANLTYLMLAQRLLREDRAEAMLRLGVGEDVAELLVSLCTEHLARIAATNMLMCRFRFDDAVVWNLLTSHKSRDENRAGVHAANRVGAPLVTAG